MNKYLVQYKVNGKPNQVTRFGANIEDTLELTKKTLAKEYLDSEKLSGWCITFLGVYK